MDAVAELVERARDAAVAAGRLLAAILAVADTALPGFDADEVAFALVWSPSAARGQVEFGRYLRDVIPGVFAALCAGVIDGRRAWVFYDVLRTADPAIASAVADRVLPSAAALTSSELRQKLRRRLIATDPAGAAGRTKRGIGGRYLATGPDGDGTAILSGVRLPAARAAAAFERLDALARGAKSAGDDRTLDQLRADLFLDLLEGTGIGTSAIHRRGITDLTVSWETATGRSDDPAELAGYGPVDAETARDLLTTNLTRDDADWRISIHGPDGELLHHTRINPGNPGRHNGGASDGHAGPPAETDPACRRPGQALSRWIIARDRTCRAPGCTTPARTCDIDHTTDHARGGPTSHDNLGLLCRHHHRLKHEGGWTLTQPQPGTFEWQSPTGAIYRQ